MKLTDVALSERVRRFVDAEALKPSRIEPLVGDASNRAYFRLYLPDDRTRVVALLPEPFEADSLPFLDGARLFEKIPIRVPHVISISGPDGVLLLEDLGDALLQDVVEEDAARKNTYYRRAIDILVRLQAQGEELADEPFLAFTVSFDESKFLWELDFFRKHFLRGYLGVVTETSEDAELDRVFAALASEIAAGPFVLCHRDYHARNLMVIDDELAVIDFQDARMGPVAYDLASLLNDSYVAHSPSFVDEMRRVFEERSGKSVAESYDAVALQRNLKALGTFGYQIGVRENDVYQRYVSHTASLIDDNLSRHPRFSELRRILTRHIQDSERLEL